jgi:flagellar hook-associated protein 1 FlgK
MASDLLSIAASGAKAARLALDVTAQNIANASSEGYVRRSLRLDELASSGGIGQVGDVSLSGVRLGSVVRNADMFRQAEVRRTGADAARGQAEVAGLENIQTAVEQSNVYPSIVKFEAALQQLASDPVDPSLRSSVIEAARTVTRTMNIASTSLDAAGTGMRFEAADGVSQVNQIAAELARVNLRLARASDASSDQTALLDQRDMLLERMSKYADVSTTIAADHTVEVRLGGTSGPAIVTGGTSDTLTMTTAANGTISFAVGATSAAISGGELAGKAQALIKLNDVRTRLNTVAASLISTVNTAQANGVDLDGIAGTSLFSGTDAATIGLNFEDGRKITTAPAGAGANSRDASNLTALRNSLATADPAGAMDAVIFDISGTVAGRTVTRDALDTIAGNARIALSAQAGVNLDQEAANLIRYQQAFQASGKAIQVASNIFDTLIALR